MQDVPKIVRARLRQAMPFTAESHPDADLLTAFVERAVAGEERDRLLEHFSRCGDCREVVALALPATEATVPATSGVAARGGWLSWPALRWSAVAAGLLVVSSVGVLKSRQHHAEKMLVSTAFAPRNQVSDNTSSSLPSSAQTFVSQTTSPSAESGESTEARPKTATAPRNTGAADKRELSADSRSVAGGNSPSRELEAMPERDLEAQASADPFEPVAKAKPAGAQGSPVGMAPAPLLRADQTLLQGHAAARWMVSPGGALQRSFDGGKTWLEVNVTVDDSMKSKAQPTIFRAVSVSANAAEVWAGGSGAALYYTADGGSRWTRVVPSTAGATLSGDIIGIQFSNPQIGTVNTSTSEIWITTDAGQTWDKQQ
jgi:hypothetical protein